MAPSADVKRAARAAARLLELRENPPTRREVALWFAVAVVALSCPDLGAAGRILGGAAGVAAVGLAGTRGVRT